MARGKKARMKAPSGKKAKVREAKVSRTAAGSGRLKKSGKTTS